MFPAGTEFKNSGIFLNAAKPIPAIKLPCRKSRRDILLFIKMRI
jgi:hypothetical protein